LAFSYWTDKPWFLTEGKLAAVLITPSLGVPNWPVIYIINTAPSKAYDKVKWSFLQQVLRIFPYFIFLI
jgi:hypothetical protein